MIVICSNKCYIQYWRLPGAARSRSVQFGSNWKVVSHRWFFFSRETINRKVIILFAICRLACFSRGQAEIFVRWFARGCSNWLLIGLACNIDCAELGCLLMLLSGKRTNQSSCTSVPRWTGDRQQRGGPVVRRLNQYPPSLELALLTWADGGKLTLMIGAYSSAKLGLHCNMHFSAISESFSLAAIKLFHVLNNFHYNLEMFSKLLNFQLVGMDWI